MRELVADEQPGPATDAMGEPLFVGGHSPWPFALLLVRVEAALDDLDQREVGDDHRDQDQEERGGNVGEAEHIGERARTAGSRRRGACDGVIIIGRLGVLRKNGTRRVRITKMIRVWVASDSTNQPERNSAWRR